MGISSLYVILWELLDPISLPVFQLGVGLYLIDKGFIVYKGNEPHVPPHPSSLSFSLCCPLEAVASCWARWMGEEQALTTPHLSPGQLPGPHSPHTQCTPKASPLPSRHPLWTFKFRFLPSIQSHLFAFHFLPSFISHHLWYWRISVCSF